MNIGIKLESICPECQELFIPKHGNQKYCSHICGQRNSMRAFWARRGISRKTRGIPEENEMNIELELRKLVMICPHCKKEFVKVDKKQKFCSNACRWRSRYERGKYLKKKMPDLFAAE